MTKKVLLFAFLILSMNSFAQKAQRIGYVDMEYILENIPDYQEAQSRINAKALSWQKDIDNKQREIDQLRADLNNESALLTEALIEEKEEDIQIKELELKNLQIARFGTEGDLFLLRQQLVKPIQDLVYNAVQDIAQKRKYDFVLDNSSDLIMLYRNDQFDISEMVLQSITREQKLIDANAKKAAKTSVNTDDESADEDTSTADAEKQKKMDDKAAKRAELQQKIADRKAAQLKKREELKKAVEDRKQQRIKEIEAAKKAKDEKKKNN